MKIQLKLMGMLKDRTPPDGLLELQEAATIGDVLQRLEIASDGVQVFSVNGSIERNQDRELTDGDDLTVLPPVGGG